MKYPSTVNTYCPYCKKYTEHKSKNYSKGTSRTMAIGNLRHERKLSGYVGKVRGDKKGSVKKQGKRQKVVLNCTVCNKKIERTIGTRTRKKLEVTA